MLIKDKSEGKFPVKSYFSNNQVFCFAKYYLNFKVMRISTIFKTAVALFLLGLMPCISTAAENKGVKLLIENFDYPAGSALVKNGKWTNYDYFGTSSSDSVRIVQGGLIYPVYQPAAIGNSVHLAEVGKDATLKFIPQQGTIYASMLVNVKSASTSAKGDFIFSFGDVSNSTTAGHGKLYVKNIDGKLAFGVARREIANPGVYASARYEFNTTYLIVIKFTQDAKDSNVELFVNPDISGAQPAALMSSKEGTNPEGLLKFVNLYQGKKEGNDATVDAVRVATSWEALFDASAVAKLPYIEVPLNTYLGIFTKGESTPITRSIIVKGENLDGDIQVSNTTTGYVTLSKNTISKADAESEKGFSYSVTLDPKDGEIEKDELTFTCGQISSVTKLTWTYIIPPPELEAQDIATLKKADRESFYTLKNAVRVIDLVPERTGGATYTIADAKDSVRIYDDGMLSFMNVKYGSVLTNLRLEVQNADPESSKFVPGFVVTESPDLTVAEGDPTGVKLFNDVFNYTVGNLAGNGDWKDFDYNAKGGEPVKLVSGGLKYMNYQTRAQGLAVELNGAGMDAVAKFGGVGGAVYASMLVSVSEASATGDYFFAFNKGASSPGDYDAFGKVCVKKLYDKVTFGISQNTFDAENAVYSDIECEFDQPVLLVVKYYQGPKDGDDYAELFINPENIMGAEPVANLKTTSVGIEPMGNLKYIELLQHSEKDGTNYKMHVDAMRVATSWPVLFDQSQVESAPEISTGQGGSIYLGFFKQGNEPEEPMVLNIKAKNLRSDLTIQGTKEGYYTFSSSSIKKEDAESENGFDVEITLNPKDGKVLNDLITITGTLARYEIYASWGYMAKANVNTVAELKAVDSGGEFTLVNTVNVESITAGEQNMLTYKLTDESGTIEVQYTKGGPGPRAKAVLDDIKAGDNVRNLCVMVMNINSEGGFTPAYSLTDSPDLEIMPSGIENILNGMITGYVNGRFIAEGAKNIKVFDVNGKRLLEVEGEVMPMNELPAAMYIVRFVNETGNVYTLKVVK